MEKGGESTCCRLARWKPLGQYTRSAAWASPAQVHRTPGSLRDGLLNINDGARVADHRKTVNEPVPDLCRYCFVENP